MEMQRNISTVHGGNNAISSDDLNYKLQYYCSQSPSASNSPANSSISYHTPISSNPSLQGLEFGFSPSPQSILVQEQQDLVNSHRLSLTRLREATKEAEALHRENTTLRVANRDLNDKIGLLIQKSLEKQVMQSDYMSNLMPAMVGAMRGLCIDAERSGVTEGYQQGFVQSPTSVIDYQSYLADGKSGGAERVALPKSISVRSNGYLKTTQMVGNMNQGGQTRSLNLPQTASSTNPAQRVYVRGGKKEGEAVELEAYNQGMIKTELCNKWQETGACPYDDHCQFAHGIHELRPVIRHPRYKTEVCRMVLAGDPCPYGHRCHFRHALTEDEKLIAAYNRRGLKLNR